MSIEPIPITQEINIPEIESDVYFEAISAQRKRIQDELLKEINSLANNDNDEILRIQSAFEWVLYGAIKEDPKFEAELETFEHKIDRPKYKEPTWKEIILSSGLVFLDLMDDGFESERLDEAMESLTLASEYLGIARGFTQSKSMYELARSTFFKQAALKRHEENYKIKADAMKYYVDNLNKFKSMDEAAEQIAGKIVNAKFRTVRSWITEYHKKLRSAGTA